MCNALTRPTFKSHDQQSEPFASSTCGFSSLFHWSRCCGRQIAPLALVIFKSTRGGKRIRCMRWKTGCHQMQLIIDLIKRLFIQLHPESFLWFPYFYFFSTPSSLELSQNGSSQSLTSNRPGPLTSGSSLLACSKSTIPISTWKWNWSSICKFPVNLIWFLITYLIGTISMQTGSSPQTMCA